MKFHLAFSILFTMVLSAASAQSRPTNCDGASAKAIIEYKDDIAYVEVEVLKLEAPINYYFFNKKGEMLNEDIKSNEVDRLKRGEYMCYMIDGKGCSVKLDFIVKENPKNND